MIERERERDSDREGVRKVERLRKVNREREGERETERGRDRIELDNNKKWKEV